MYSTVLVLLLSYENEFDIIYPEKISNILENAADDIVLTILCVYWHHKFNVTLL
jgi:hypothetical protein